MELVLHEEINEVFISSGVRLLFSYSLFLSHCYFRLNHMKLPFLWVK